MSQVEKKDVAWLVNGAKPLTLNAPGLVSDSFTWETVETLDFGFDINCLERTSAKYFRLVSRDTKDMLAPGAELRQCRCFRTFAEYRRLAYERLGIIIDLER